MMRWRVRVLVALCVVLYLLAPDQLESVAVALVHAQRNAAAVSPPPPKLRAAFILRGAMSIARRGTAVSEGGPVHEYVNFASCAIATRKYIFDANPEVHFDTYIFSWNVDLRESLLELYHPRAARFVHQANVSDTLRTFGGDYKQAATAYAIQKGYELVEETTREPYDYIVWYRPDVLLWVPMVLSEYDSTQVYVNGDDNADFHFVMNQTNARTFSQLLTSSSFNTLLAHHWIREYVNKVMKMPLLGDKLTPGRSQEVVRKMKAVPNFRAIIAEFGLSVEEVERYEISLHLGSHIAEAARPRDTR